ncbi:MAG: YbgA family protein [Vagococcus sp.]
MTTRLQEEWASQKYNVMSKSQTEYNYIRSLFGRSMSDEDRAIRFYDALHRANQSTPTKGSLINTYQHVWGYFKKLATADERQEFSQLVSNFDVTHDNVLPFLQRMTIHYHVSYLENSTLLFPKKHSESSY